MGIPPEWSFAKILEWKKAADRGEPIPWEFQRLDGGPPEVEWIPLHHDTMPAPKPKRARPGRPRVLTLKQLADHIRRKPGPLSPRRRAQMLSNELQRPISRSTVNRLLQELAHPQNSGSK